MLNMVITVAGPSWSIMPHGLKHFCRNTMRCSFHNGIICNRKNKNSVNNLFCNSIKLKTSEDQHGSCFLLMRECHKSAVFISNADQTRCKVVTVDVDLENTLKNTAKLNSDLVDRGLTLNVSKLVCITYVLIAKTK